MANILILGANGFIGQHLTNSLHNLGHTITAFDRFSSFAKQNEQPFHDLANVTAISGDFFARNELRELLHGVDYVFHLVTATTPAVSNGDPFIDIDTNIRTSIELFELCVEMGVKKVIFPSSGGTVYGEPSVDIINELVAPQPRSPYGIGKLAIEHYLRYFKANHGLDYIVYRIANPYGPGQNIHGRQGVVPIFMSNILDNKPIKIFGDGSMVRDYLYISDLVDMIVKSFEKPNQYAEYNLGSGQGQSVNELVRAIEQCSGQKFTKEFTEAPSTFVHKSVLDTTRFLNEFGVSPGVDLNDGIRRTWDYVKTIKS